MALKLQEDKKQNISNWLAAKAPDLKCPACGASDWSIGDFLLGMPTVSLITSIHGDVRSDSSLFRVVQIICNNCGYVMNFDATKLRQEYQIIDAE
jgi:predicted nucleic-acid-binding Zn-ribbon protein